MKLSRIFSALLSVVVCVTLLSVNSFAANNDKVVDAADLLSDNEEQQLEERLVKIVSEYGYDIAVVTVNSTDGKTMMAYADDYYDYNGYGEDGLMLLVDMGRREWWITTDGKGISAFTDAGIQSIGGRVAENLSAEWYYDAFCEFADLSEMYIKAYEETGKPYGEQKNYVVIAIISLVIGAIIAAIVCLVLKAQLKTAVMQTNAKAYVRNGTPDVDFARDIFLYSELDRRKIETDSGSSTHTSSSGDTHGGGGGSF